MGGGDRRYMIVVVRPQSVGPNTVKLTASAEITRLPFADAEFAKLRTNRTKEKAIIYLANPFQMS